jgi:hypothetical protein
MYERMSVKVKENSIKRVSGNSRKANFLERLLVV